MAGVVVCGRKDVVVARGSVVAGASVVVGAGSVVGTGVAMVRSGGRTAETIGWPVVGV